MIILRVFKGFQGRWLHCIRAGKSLDILSRTECGDYSTYKRDGNRKEYEAPAYDVAFRVRKWQALCPKGRSALQGKT